LREDDVLLFHNPIREEFADDPPKIGPVASQPKFSLSSLRATRPQSNTRLDHLQQRDEHWAIVDLVGKGCQVRTVPVPDWVRTELDDWITAAAIDRGKLFRRVNKVGRTWGDGMTVKAVWHIVKESAKRIGVAKLAPHDLRRTCARLCHASGGELEQIQFLLGHVSVQTTERYLGCKQRIRSAVNDRIGIEPNP
jgi:integrase